jgi:hypothetical protein
MLKAARDNLGRIAKATVIHNGFEPRVLRRGEECRRSAE